MDRVPTTLKNAYGILLVVVFSWQANAEEMKFEDPVIGAAGYHVGSYGDGAYWVSDGLTNSMFVVSDEGVIIVDAPPSYAESIPAAVAAVTDQPITHFVYSHYHKDHTGGAAVFGEEVTYIGHSETVAQLTRIGDANRPVPTISFDDKFSLEVGNQTIELAYDGLNHTPGNIIAYLPEQKVLMLVDVVYPAVVPFARLGIAAHVPGYYGIIETARNYDFVAFQGGHLGRPGSREEFEVAREYVLDLRNSAFAALRTTQPPLPFILPDNPIADPYYAMSSYFDAASANCAEIVEQKWATRLEGTRSFAQGHCWTAILETVVE